MADFLMMQDVTWGGSPPIDNAPDCISQALNNPFTLPF